MGLSRRFAATAKGRILSSIRSREEKESVEVDSELDKSGKPNLGSNHQLTVLCW